MRVSHRGRRRLTVRGVKHGLDMVVSPKRYTEETQVFSVRMPKDMIRELDSLAQRTGRTRNELIMMSLEFSLEHMEITDDPGRKQ